jgi:hypothetical protein
VRKPTCESRRAKADVRKPPCECRSQAARRAAQRANVPTGVRRRWTTDRIKREAQSFDYGEDGFLNKNVSWCMRRGVLGLGVSARGRPTAFDVDKGRSLRTLDVCSTGRHFCHAIKLALDCNEPRFYYYFRNIGSRKTTPHTKSRQAVTDKACEIVVWVSIRPPNAQHICLCEYLHVVPSEIKIVHARDCASAIIVKLVFIVALVCYVRKQLSNEKTCFATNQPLVCLQQEPCKLSNVCSRNVRAYVAMRTQQPGERERHQVCVPKCPDVERLRVVGGIKCCVASLQLLTSVTDERRPLCRCLTMQKSGN